MLSASIDRKVVLETIHQLLASAPSASIPQVLHPHKSGAAHCLLAREQLTAGFALRMLAGLRDSVVNHGLSTMACMACSGQSAPGRAAQPAQCYTLGHRRRGGGGHETLRKGPVVVLLTYCYCVAKAGGGGDEGGGDETLGQGPVAPQPVPSRPRAAPPPIAPPHAHCVATRTHQCCHTHTTSKSVDQLCQLCFLFRRAAMRQGAIWDKEQGARRVRHGQCAHCAHC